jgi:glycogen synthase
MGQRRPSVLIVSWEYPPIVEGGLARHVGKLSVGLVACGVDVHVLSRGDRATPLEEESAGVRIHRMVAGRWPSDPDRFVSWVARLNAGLLDAGRLLADEFDFDLIHAHDWLVAAAAEGLADELDRPLVTTIHATEYGRHQGWIVGQPQTRIHYAERRVVHRSDRVIACSEFMRGHIADVLGADERRIRVIANGVAPDDLAEPRPETLAGLRRRFATPGEPLVLMVGRLVYEKGFQLALAALPGLIARIPGLRFVVAGTGIHEAALVGQAAQLGLDRHGSFLGWVADPVLRSLYRIAAVCVIPSIYEPAGLVALEAMACGCPCVVADTGGLREAVPHEVAGLRFTTRDPRALAEAVDRLLGDEPLRRSLVATAAAHVRSFDWERASRATADVYAELLPDRLPVPGDRVRPVIGSAPSSGTSRTEYGSPGPAWATEGGTAGPG